MGATNIEWVDYTFNPWIGCAKVSPGCDHCYAEAMAKRRKWATWGTTETRYLPRSTWSNPARWNRKGPARVFCASLADVFDNKAPTDQRDRLWRMIRATPNLEWRLLTKRPQNIARFLPADWGDGYANVRLGVTTENQLETDRRLTALANVPAVLDAFVSAEPLLEAVDLTAYLPRIALVLVGAESGPGARPMDEQWVRALRDQCLAAGTCFFYKQRIERGRKVSLPELDGLQWAEQPPMPVAAEPVD